MYCSCLFINERVWWMYMFVYTLYKLSMSVYGYVFIWKCKFAWWTCVVLYICMNNCCICLHVWMAPGKISCKEFWHCKPSFSLNYKDDLCRYFIYKAIYLCFIVCPSHQPLWRETQNWVQTVLAAPTYCGSKLIIFL